METNPMDKKTKPLKGRTLILAGAILILAAAALGFTVLSLYRWKTTPAIAQEIPAIPAQPDAVVSPQFGFPEEKPTIQISEETKNVPIPTPTPSAPIPTKLPKGFGLQTEGDSETATEPAPDAPQKLEESPVTLETPTEPPSKSPQKIESIDPRKIGVTANDGPDKDYEETILTVQRTLTAQLENGDKQLIRLKVPVMYKSRTLRLDEAKRKEAAAILKNLKDEKAALIKIKADLEANLAAWNKLVSETTPNAALLPESPTLPQNQSSDKLNREENPNMAPGKAISYEIINPKN